MCRRHNVPQTTGIITPHVFRPRTGSHNEPQLTATRVDGSLQIFVRPLAGSKPIYFFDSGGLRRCAAATHRLPYAIPAGSMRFVQLIPAPRRQSFPMARAPIRRLRWALAMLNGAKFRWWRGLGVASCHWHRGLGGDRSRRCRNRWLSKRGGFRRWRCPRDAACCSYSPRGLCWPSVDSWQAVTQLEWPLKTLRVFPEAVSQSRRLRSSLAERTLLPSGESRQAVTQFEWPSKTLRISPVASSLSSM